MRAGERRDSDSIPAVVVLLAALVCLVLTFGPATSSMGFSDLLSCHMAWPSWGRQAEWELDWEADGVAQPYYSTALAELDGTIYIDQAGPAAPALGLAGLLLVVSIAAAGRAAWMAPGRRRRSRDLGVRAMHAEALSLARLASLPARVGTLALAIAIAGAAWCTTQDLLNDVTLWGFWTCSDRASTPWGNNVTFVIGVLMALVGHMVSGIAGAFAARRGGFEPGGER